MTKIYDRTGKNKSLFIDELPLLCETDADISDDGIIEYKGIKYFVYSSNERDNWVTVSQLRTQTPDELGYDSGSSVQCPYCGAYLDSYDLYESGEGSTFECPICGADMDLSMHTEFSVKLTKEPEIKHIVEVNNEN